MHNYSRLLQYARRQRRSLFLIFALTLAAAGLIALQPWPMKILVDHVIRPSPEHAQLESVFRRFGLSANPLTFLLLATFGTLALFALNSAVETALTSAWTLAGRRMVYDLAADLFARLQRSSLLFHSRSSVGDIMSRITGDSWCVYQLVDALLFAPLHALLTMAMMIFLMAQLDWRLMWLSLVVAPFMVLASLLIGRPLHLAAKMKREIESRIQSHVQQTLTGIPVVQAFAQEDRERERFERFADAAIRAQQRSTLLGSVNNLSSGLITTLGSGVVIWVGARHVIEDRLALGSLLVFVVYLASLQTQMKVFANLHSTLRTVNASINRVMEVLNLPAEVAEEPGAPALPVIRGKLEFHNVVFGYERSVPVLHGISLEANPGETVALVGPTGAGKSTLVNLIPRFFDPWEGSVTIDGHHIRDFRIESLRRQIAIVLQEPFLFPISVAENISYGRPEATQEEIVDAARAANAHAFIERLPQGYGTILSERGTTLSGGERQRLAIARALLKNAPVLILDEPTSALDAETENLLLEALERLMAGRTTFIIAHRLSTIRRADCILVLQNGRIIERGTHAELIARQEFYAHLHQVQFGGPPIAASTRS